MKIPLRTASAFAALLAGVLALSGCSVVDEVVYNQRFVEYADVAEMTADGDHDVTWVPADGASIRMVESTVASDAALLVASASALDPTLCVAGDRLSAPSYAIEGAPDVYAISDAFVCGAWTVVAADDGWYGWTPNSPGERAAG